MINFIASVFDIFQELKSFFEETKLEVEQAHSTWKQELERLGIETCPTFMTMLSK